MTHVEISKALALAIGWPEERVNVVHGCVSITVAQDDLWKSTQSFDYRDWNVAGPIAERYNCFPYGYVRFVEWESDMDGNLYYADTPQKAIALAVIGAAA